MLMFKTLFGRVEKTEETIDPRYELYDEMRQSLFHYTEALNHYQEMRRDIDESSPLVTVALATLEHYRSIYYNLRLKYEQDYGNEAMYLKSVSNVESWATNTGLRLLMRPVADCFLRNRH